MKDYNHNGTIDSEDEVVFEDLFIDEPDNYSGNHSFMDVLKGFVLVIIGLLILVGLIMFIF
jgi:hypothetical protein